MPRLSRPTSAQHTVKAVPLPSGIPGEKDVDGAVEVDGVDEKAPHPVRSRPQNARQIPKLRPSPPERRRSQKHKRDLDETRRATTCHRLVGGVGGVGGVTPKHPMKHGVTSTERIPSEMDVAFPSESGWDTIGDSTDAPDGDLGAGGLQPSNTEPVEPPESRFSGPSPFEYPPTTPLSEELALINDVDWNIGQESNSKLRSVVTVEYGVGNPPTDFDAGLAQVDAGDAVVVETDRGLAIGKVIYPPIRRLTRGKLPRLLRRVSRNDDRQRLRNKEREADAFRTCKARIAELRLPMKLTEGRIDAQRKQGPILFQC